MSPMLLRQAVIDTARRLNSEGLTVGASGNVSVRSGEGFLVTPTGMNYGALEPSDIVWMHLDGTVPPGQRRPSSEWRFHRDLYAARPDISAVVHAHSPWSTALACCGKGIPAFHYMVAVAGGEDIRCAPYATFGSEELSAHAVEAMDGRLACLLGNHGLLAAGHTLDHAFAVAQEVETLAAQYARALQIGGVQLIDREEMKRVLEKFRTYGQQEES